MSQTAAFTTSESVKKSQRVTFPGSFGYELAGKLEMPYRPPVAYALFAHCFSCSKDVFAANRIARRLALQGFGVLRFDFTGLGQSEGDFANTNFSSNVADLVAAADFLRETHGAPALLVGHSLGGAAVLLAAAQVPEVKAVATIGAPADVSHVSHHFADALEEIETQGEANVSLAGRPFRIKKQFLQDIRAQKVTDAVAELRRPLMIFHSPTDETVGVQNASTLFMAAKHPKSFVGLEGADHLLTRERDAHQVADTLAAWAGRYIEAAGASIPVPEAVPGQVVVQETGHGRYQNVVVDGKHVYYADEPARLGGDDTGPTPGSFLAAALGTCTSITLRMYAERKELPVERIRVGVDYSKFTETDADGTERERDLFRRHIRIEGDLDPDSRNRMLQIANRCPVHRTLERSSHIETLEDLIN